MVVAPPTLALPTLLLLLVATLLSAEPGNLVVVVHRDQGVTQLTRDQVINIFLGRFRQLPDGSAALPLDHPQGDVLRDQFYLRLVNKKPSEIRAYWARLVFSGKTSPPRQAKDRQQVLDWLHEEPGAVGYLDDRGLPDWLRPVYRLTP